MTATLRFHLDESVDPAIANGLRRRGVDVTTSREAGLLRSSDEQQLAFASTAQRVLVSHDEDFLALARRGIEHCGIAYCHPESRAIGQIIAGLLLIRDCLTAEEMRNHIEFLRFVSSLKTLIDAHYQGQPTGCGSTPRRSSPPGRLAFVVGLLRP
jgi:hypothetical protein